MCVGLSYIYQWCARCVRLNALHKFDPVSISVVVVDASDWQPSTGNQHWCVWSNDVAAYAQTHQTFINFSRAHFATVLALCIRLRSVWHLAGCCRFVSDTLSSSSSSGALTQLLIYTILIRMFYPYYTTFRHRNRKCGDTVVVRRFLTCATFHSNIISFFLTLITLRSFWCVWTRKWIICAI